MVLAHPDWVRLDGRTATEPSPKRRSGIAAYVWHDGKRFQVDADCRIDNLLAAYRAWKDGKVKYPVVVGPSSKGKTKLIPAPGAGDPKGFFIYNPENYSQKVSGVAAVPKTELDNITHADADEDLGQIDPLEQVSTTRGKRDAAFRRRIFNLWGARCALTGCEDVAVLDAAHLAAHAKTGDNRASNGIPLRTDLNRLMETGGLTFRVEADVLIVQIAPSITFEQYRVMDGKKVPIPS